MPIKHKFKAATILLLLISLSFFYVFHIVSMWQKASILTKDASSSLSVFVEASEFLSQNLSKDDIALVPMRDVFYVLNPQLKDKLVDYKSLWDSQGILLQANTTIDEMLKVRSHLINFLKENTKVRFIIRDWNDPYAVSLYETTINDELMVILREVKVMRFTLSTGWGSEITIYENVNYKGEN